VVNNMDFFGLNQVSLAAKDRKERKEQALYFYAFFRG